MAWCGLREGVVCVKRGTGTEVRMDETSVPLAVDSAVCCRSFRALHGWRTFADMVRARYRDEILNGKTLDRNSNYFARFCFENGIDL